MADSVRDILAEGAIGAEVTRLELLGDTEHVLQHEDLSIGGGAGTGVD